MKEKLIQLFSDNFKQFESQVNESIIQAGPKSMAQV